MDIRERVISVYDVSQIVTKIVLAASLHAFCAWRQQEQGGVERSAAYSGHLLLTTGPNIGFSL
jgi:hypothetical protein